MKEKAEASDRSSPAVKRVGEHGICPKLHRTSLLTANFLKLLWFAQQFVNNVFESQLETVTNRKA